MLHTCFLLWDVLKSACLILHTERRPGWKLIAFVFSRKCWMHKFIWFLLVPQSRAELDGCCVYAHNCLQSLLPLLWTVSSGSQQWSCGRGKWFGWQEHWEYILAHCGDPWTICPQQLLIERLTDRVCNTVRICLFIMLSENPDCCSSSLFPHSTYVTQSLLNGVGKKWVSLTASCLSGGAKCTLTCRRNQGQVLCVVLWEE